jgi:dynein assembly factor 5
MIFCIVCVQYLYFILQIGAQFERENEEDLKDQMDFMQLIEAMPGLPFERPRLGCRVLVYRTFSKILPALLKDIVDWTANSRIKASQLLYTLLYHLEEHATHHIHAIVNALYKACQDEESIVVEQAVRCSEVIGYYVSVEVWSSLVLPAVKTSAGCYMGSSGERSTVPVGPVQCTSCLMVLAGCLQGAKNVNLQPFLKMVCECVSANEVGQSESLPLLQQLLNCVTAIVNAAATNCHFHSTALFSVLLRIAASRHALSLKFQVEKAMNQLADMQGMTCVWSLYEAHANNIIHSIKLNYQGWTINTPDCALFSSLLSGAGHVLGQILDDVIPVLTQCLNPDGDPEMRLHYS